MILITHGIVEIPTETIIICQSKSVRAWAISIFSRATKRKHYSIEPNQNTIRLHQEMYATSCPHRFVEIYGGASGCNWNDPKMVRMVTQDALVFQWIDSSCSNKKSPVEIPG